MQLLDISRHEYNEWMRRLVLDSIEVAINFTIYVYWSWHYFASLWGLKRLCLSRERKFVVLILFSRWFVTTVANIPKIIMQCTMRVWMSALVP